jgi:TonB family protein
MRNSHVVTMMVCLALPLVSGCGGHVPQPGSGGTKTTDAPIVWASTVGGCNQPSHAPYPEYGTVVPFTGEPTPTRKVPPAYPELARQQGVQGTVVLAALVCEHGRVVATRVIDSIPMLDEAATNCVRQWDFSAANIRDLRVAAWTIVPVKFSLH